jgi:putative endonuclease
MPYYVYLLASRTKRLYVGVTNNLERRVGEHKSGCTGGFSKRYNIHHLVYYEEHECVLGAIERENSSRTGVEKRT